MKFYLQKFNSKMSMDIFELNISPAVSDFPFIFEILFVVGVMVLQRRHLSHNNNNLCYGLWPTTRLTIYILQWNYCNSKWHLTVFFVVFGNQNNPNAFFSVTRTRTRRPKGNRSTFCFVFLFRFIFRDNLPPHIVSEECKKKRRNFTFISESDRPR